MNSISLSKRKALHQAVSGWYRRHRRDLQWRMTQDPYEILVSEIMLQQTQVRRVQEKLPLFLHRFPTLRVLARAPKAEVIRAWQGMGYNNRAVRLSELCRIIIEKYHGRLPADVSELQSLPGIGPYTAHALVCFAFRKRVPVVDVNIRRVFLRLLDIKSDNEKHVWELATHLLPDNSYAWNQALMDLGATICTARNPLCSLCPVAAMCKSRTKLGKSISQTVLHKAEPSYKGLPRRIWRGKIIQALRTGGVSISLPKLGKAIRLSGRDISWVSDLVARLEKDGLVCTKKIAASTYVSLAA